MKLALLILVAQTCCIIVKAELCEDVDSAACARIANVDPNMCNDFCIANMCKRHCGHCPLKCYLCIDITTADTCNTTKVCPSFDHSCTVVKSYTNDFRPVFKLGCANNSICQAEDDFDCCTTDLCNHHVLNTRSDNANLRVTNRSQSGVCANIDDQACNLLHKAIPNMCNEDCIGTALCPRLCGKCYECYDCDHVSRTENCNTTRVCESDHVCYTIETLNFNLEHGFKVGCVHNKVCNALLNEASNIFGRRDSTVELSLNGGCCRGDLCNLHKILPATTTMAPTTATAATTTTTSKCHYLNNCPIGYHEVDGKCYDYVLTEMTWSEAQNNCKRTCGKLAEFSDLNELRDFTHHDKSISSTTLHHSSFYVGAHDPTLRDHWEWASNGHSLPHNIIDRGVEAGQYCGTIRVGHPEINRAHCTSNKYSICQADYQH